MSLISRVFGRRSIVKASPHEAWFWDLISSIGKSASGQRVTPTSAMQNPAFFAGVRALSQDIAKLPLIVQRVSADGDKRERWRDNPLWYLLHDRPNDSMTSYRWRMAMQAQLMAWGNAYAEIMFDRRGKVAALVPFKPGVVHVTEASDGALFYNVRDGSRSETLPADRVFHLRDFTLDGSMGYSVVTAMREAIGLGLAAQEYAARFYSNDATPRGIIEHPSHFATDEARSKFREIFQSMLTGENRHKALVLEGGTKFVQTQMSNEAAQFIETRKHQRSEIAASLRVPPHKIGDLERATFSNIEHQAIEYTMDTLLAHVRNWESELTHMLVPEDQRGITEIKFVLDGQLRGDVRTRYAAYSVGRQWGWLSANDVRRLEDMNPIEGGDVYLTPMNMQDANAPVEEPAEPADDTESEPGDQEDNQDAQGSDNPEPRAIPFVGERGSEIIRPLRRAGGSAD